MASYLLPCLTTKHEVDNVIRHTEEVVLVLRFGRDDDHLAKAVDDLAKMAKIYAVNVDHVPVYTRYFDITLIPATIFFFNAQHMKVDWGTADHTKFIGTFKCKQDFIDVVEVIFRGAMKGKLMVQSPLDPTSLQKYELVYKEI
ncbi:thioredoxin-like protein 4B isoform X2 [Dreissena polymorpha]|uniref:thioredoxin-like protein 4B isoform X2 n=1 Tax=Dreissena polymorpha TaxID=45954 RepID=UPI0022643A33|nr:thioredoxin-like protein 4B isoform X2 [Dreissena polymorpha]